MRIYVASSWRNDRQPSVVTVLRAAGHDVYDFRDPEHGNTVFTWDEIDPDFEHWSKRQFRDSLRHPLAKSGFASDFGGMQWCEACVMVLPCGRSASLELGWCIGTGRRSIVLLDDGKPDLMFKLADHVCVSMDEVVSALDKPAPVQ